MVSDKPSKLMRKTCENLGELYTIQTMDKTPAIYRYFDNGIEFEVLSIETGVTKCSLYVWYKPQRELVGVYKNIPIAQLRDVLGHFAYIYQGLDKIVEIQRQDWKGLE